VKRPCGIHHCIHLLLHPEIKYLALVGFLDPTPQFLLGERFGKGGIGDGIQFGLGLKSSPQSREQAAQLRLVKEVERLARVASASSHC
jgi:hypothetical protein